MMEKYPNYTGNTQAASSCVTWSGSTKCSYTVWNFLANNKNTFKADCTDLLFSIEMLEKIQDKILKLPTSLPENGYFSNICCWYPWNTKLDIHTDIWQTFLPF